MSLYTEMTTLQSNILTSAFSIFFRHFLSIQKKLLHVNLSKLKKIALIRFIRHKPKKSAERFLYTAHSENVRYTCRKYSRCKLVNIQLWLVDFGIAQLSLCKKRNTVHTTDSNNFNDLSTEFHNFQLFLTFKVILFTIFFALSATPTNGSTDRLRRA